MWYVICVVVGGPAWNLVADAGTARVGRLCEED